MGDDNHGCCCDKEVNWEEKEQKWEDHMKDMTNEELEIKKEKLTRKLAMVNKLLKEKK